VSRGHRVTIVAGTVNHLTHQVPTQYRGKLLHQEWVDGIKILRTYTFAGYGRSFNLRALNNLSFMVTSVLGGVRLGEYDVVYATSLPIFVGLSGLFLSRWRSRPMIFEVRDLFPESAVSMGVLSNPGLIVAFELMERFLYAKAQKIVVVSPAFQKSIREKGVPVERIEVIPHGSDLKLFSPQPRENWVRQEYGLKDRYVLIYAGAHGFANGLDVILGAAEQLQRKTPDIIILLVGEGTEKERLKAMARKRYMHNVLFFGPQSKQKIADFINAADCTLLTLRPAKVVEKVLPNKLFDYMACGRPVILNFKGEAYRVLQKAGGGMLAEGDDPEVLAEAIMTLYRQRELGEEMGARNRTYVERFHDRLVLARDLENLLEEVVIKSSL